MDFSEDAHAIGSRGIKYPFGAFPALTPMSSIKQKGDNDRGYEKVHSYLDSFRYFGNRSLAPWCCGFAHFQTVIFHHQTYFRLKTYRLKKLNSGRGPIVFGRIGFLLQDENSSHPFAHETRNSKPSPIFDSTMSNLHVLIQFERP